MCLFNLDKDTKWCKVQKDGYINLFRNHILNNGDLLSYKAHRSSDTIRPLTLIKVTNDGSDIKSFNYKRKGSSVGKIGPHFFGELSTGEILVLFVNDIGEKSNLGLLKLSKDLKIIDDIIFELDNLSTNFASIGVDKNDNIYLPLQFQNPENHIGNERDGAIVKFDKNLNLVWSKKVVAENFSIKTLSLSTFDESTIFQYSTESVFPMITAKINSDGELLWKNGYSMATALGQIANDSSFVVLGHQKYFENGTSEPAILITKTRPDGTIDGCPIFDSCLSLFDFPLPTTKWDWERSDTILEINNLPFTIDTIDFTLTDHCGTPRPPTPYFLTPDTICQNQCLRPDSLYNHLAHAVEWTITGNNILFENRDTSFNYCFNAPGKYQIEQEVWLLGCSDFFTREVVVLPDSLGDLLGDDRVICEDTFAILKPNATRPLRDYLWSDSSRDSSLTVSESGIYGVEVSDGFCTANDEVEVSFFYELFSGVDLDLPNDTSICQELLPFTLTPKSDFSNEFFLNGSTTPQSNFEIKTAGNYQISTTIEGCEITKEFNLSLIPCEVDIYIPSSFSPNNDGINDVLEPLGNHFIGQQMQVFDRWGGLLFETKNPPFAWDGDKAEEGVYVVTFSYFNLKNQQEEIVSGDVLVVR